MGDSLYGYRFGPQVLVKAKVDSSTSAIKKYDMLTWATAGYVKQASANDTIIGFSNDDCAVPSADGDAEILMDVSTLSIYEYPPDTGTVTQALVGYTMDCGGAKSVNIDASTDDCLEVVAADVGKNTIFVRRVAVLTGVV